MGLNCPLDLGLEILPTGLGFKVGQNGPFYTTGLWYCVFVEAASHGIKISFRLPSVIVQAFANQYALSQISTSPCILFIFCLYISLFVQLMLKINSLIFFFDVKVMCLQTLFFIVLINFSATADFSSVCVEYIFMLLSRSYDLIDLLQNSPLLSTHILFGFLFESSKIL